MIIVRVCGGLGNQMFDYALYLVFKNRGLNAKLDISWYDNIQSHNGYELERVFGIKADIATKKECSKYAFWKLNFKDKLLKRLIKRPKFYSQFLGKESGFDNLIMTASEGYIEGYFQSELYFKHIDRMVRTEFTFGNIELYCSDVIQKIKESASVSLHIRRGDYLKNNKKLLCNTSYYDDAINIIQNRRKQPIFFVFSNDIEWCRKKFTADNYVFVDCNQGKNSYMDMYLMSICKDNIIADSTFSWWGAWLNNKEDKIVIAPKSWTYMSRNYTNIIPDSWMTL